MTEITSQNGTAPVAMSGRGLRVTNSSGYPGVSWHKQSQKWAAYIRRSGPRRFLGLFATAEAAAAAYRAADEKLSRPPTDPELDRTAFLAAVRAHYEERGLEALALRVLGDAGLRHRMEKLGLRQADVVAALGLTDEFERHRKATFKYRGVEKPQWNWPQAVATARTLLEAEGDLPTIPWCRRNGQSHLVNVVFQTGHTWEELRAEVGLPPSRRYFSSRSGRRWRSRPEACLSNYLHARNIEHTRGEPYPPSYAAQSGRKSARYDMHFRAADGEWINVEVWGNLAGDHFGGGRYAETRKLKEAWHKGDGRFLGIDHTDCLSDATLDAILQPYIGNHAPVKVAKDTDALIETAHWSNADEVVDTCRQIASTAPDGIFPSDEWLRKRGRHADRDGPAYNSLAVYVQKWLGGTRKVRSLLGQQQASTTKWSVEKVKVAWQAFEQKHGMSPQRANMLAKHGALPQNVTAEACRIWTAANRLDVRDPEIGIRQGRVVYWTHERIVAEWAAFTYEVGLQPTECMSASKRKQLPKTLCNRATSLYSAAARQNLLEDCRTANRSQPTQAAVFRARLG